MILLLFRRSTDHGVGERILSDFGASFAAWAQVFDRVRGLYALSESRRAIRRHGERP